MSYTRYLTNPLYTHSFTLGIICSIKSWSACSQTPKVYQVDVFWVASAIVFRVWQTAWSRTMNIRARRFFEMSKRTQWRIPENPSLEYHLCENLKSSILRPNISTSTFFQNTKSLFSAYSYFARFADLKTSKSSLFYYLIHRSF